jgi:hypothetical protein
LIIPTPGNEVYKRGPEHLTKLLQHLEGPAQQYTSLANEDDEANRQKIIQPLIADLNSEIQTRFALGKKSKTEEKYWTGAIEKKLDKSNDHFGQTLGAESIVRIAAQELHSDDSLPSVPAIFLPREGAHGRDFYFTVMEPKDAAEIFGESLGKLAETLKKKD